MPAVNIKEKAMVDGSSVWGRNAAIFGNISHLLMRKVKWEGFRCLFFSKPLFLIFFYFMHWELRFRKNFLYPECSIKKDCSPQFKTSFSSPCDSENYSETVRFSYIFVTSYFQRAVHLIVDRMRRMLEKNERRDLIF